MKSADLLRIRSASVSVLAHSRARSTLGGKLSRRAPGASHHEPWRDADNAVPNPPRKICRANTETEMKRADRAVSSAAERSEDPRVSAVPLFSSVTLDVNLTV